MDISTLRVGWATVLVLTGIALLPDSPPPGLIAAWVLLAIPGTLVVSRRSFATPRGEWLASRRTRHLAAAAGALLVFAALVFSPSAALFLATGLGSAALVAGPRVLEHATALGGALVLVLVPLEFVLRVEPVARRFGLPSERSRQEASYDRLWERNLFRFRSHHETVARRNGVKRIIALGDSFTWGLLIPNSDSVWPARLERELTITGDAVEVINMGQRGWATANEAEFLRRLGWQFAPDLIIVQFFLNDAYESGPNFEYREGNRILLLPEQFARGYVAHSALSSLVAKGVNGLVYGMLLSRREQQDLYREDAAGWRQMRAALREIGDSARARHTPVLFVLFPALLPGTWTPTTYPLVPIYNRVAAEAQASGLHVLDLTDAFAAEGGDWIRWWATPYDSHPNAAAHAVAASAIAERIRARQLLR